MARRTHDQKRAVVEFLECVGEASPAAIGTALGIKSDQQNALQKLLGRLLHRGLLVRSGHGSYSLSPTYELFAFDNFDLTERAIERHLEEKCGVADTDDIAKAVSARRLEGGSRDSEHRRVTLALKESPKFSQDYGSGRWCLTRDARDSLPLLGRWADLEIQRAWFERHEHNGFESWEAKRAAFFRRVGAAFAEARDDLSLMDVVRDPTIAAALKAIGDRAHEVRRDLLHMVQDELTNEARERELPVWDYVMAHQETRLLVNLLGEFERGDVRLHLAASPELYRGCAALYRTCGALLSRGVVSSESATAEMEVRFA